MGNLDLYCIPAGGSGTDLLLEEAAKKEYGTTLFVTSSRELVNKARGRNVNAANFEYLVNEVLRRLGPDNERRQLISRKTQELIVEKLLADGRVDFMFPADYRAGTELDRTVQDILQRMAITDRLLETNIRKTTEY